MTTIRRTYAYLLAFVGLAVLAQGVASLGQLLVDVLLDPARANDAQSVRNSVALFGSMSLVGLPVWLLHWLWIEHKVRDDTSERTSALRRLYLYVVLAGAMVVLALSVHDSLSNLILALTGQSSIRPRLDTIVRDLPFAVVALVGWFAHWRIAARDRALAGEDGRSATLRRWYIYGAAFVGWVTLLAGTASLLQTLWELLVSASTYRTAAGLSGPISATLIGGAVWVWHWALLPERRDDGVATLHSVYLFLALSVAVVGALFGASQLLYYAVGRALDVEHPGGVGGDLLQAAAGPASLAIIYGIGWAYQRQALRRQAGAFAEAPRQAGIRRLYTYLVALVALWVLATGLAGLLWTLADLLLAAPVAFTGDGWRGNVALFSTLVIVGLPVWALHWQSVVSSEAEVRSLARRLYVYLSLIGATLSLITGAAWALYRILSLLLGEASSVSVLTDLSHALAIAIVAAAVAGYHWRVLRSDLHRQLPSSVSVPVSVSVEGETPTPAQVTVQLRAADAATLERALSTLRASGVDVSVYA